MPLCFDIEEIVMEHESIKNSFCTALISGFVGVLLGIIAGYFLGCTDFNIESYL